jgi:hypothetical protein
VAADAGLVGTDRLMTEADLPWLRELFARRYPKHFDPIATEGWIVNQVLRFPVFYLAIRSDDAFLIGQLGVEPWTPTQVQANVVAVCVDDRIPSAYWQAIGLLRGSLYWAKLRKVSVWRITSETDFDLAPLARRIGAREISSRFELKLEYR